MNRYDLFVKAGQSLVLAVTWKDSEGNPINLTGAWAGCTFRREHGGPELFSVSTDDASILVTPLDGIITVRVSPELSTLLNPNERKRTKGVFDLKVVLPSGETVFLIWDGRWNCDPSATDITPED